jgi:hypothetical protein
MYSLKNDRVVLIRDKYLTADGHLVIQAEYWYSEADHAARPYDPRASHDHLFIAQSPISPDDPHVLAHIREVLNAAISPNGDCVMALRHHSRGNHDRHGWMAHPHVAALEVTKHFDHREFSPKFKPLQVTQ